jgi:polyhydroxyalkanoate synthesis regulator phasin
MIDMKKTGKKMFGRAAGAIDACIGAISMTGEGAARLYGECVHRGSEVRENGMEAFGEAMRSAAEALSGWRTRLVESMSEAASRINWATRHDLALLERKIEHLLGGHQPPRPRRRAKVR